MKLDYYEKKIPTWAICYLVNGDASGLDDHDIKRVDEWLADFPPIVSFEFEEEPYFTHNPAFGEACEVEDCKMFFESEK